MKIIANVIAYQLSPLVSHFLLPNQFGFVHGRNVEEFIAAVSECVILLNNHSFRGNMTIKVGIHKVFDTMN